ncbi:L-aspartate oxidase [Leucobacter triazinivorans]|uniref:L-aspartate oxidase n=1 Tax=Leucobacter triazinivorans TaxID=1784719 RepID=A0A4P6KDC2_9MICO|nr:FAD-binding protein [Leucobacter triazinivorans]QBE48212.1 FAD-binding protein [Leucobacter triazinivorans]
MILVIGSGVAGLACAVAAATGGADVTLATPGALWAGDAGDAGDRADDRVSGGRAADALAGGSTALAQGGIAAALGAGDTPAQHLADTVAAGVGLVDAEAAEVLTTSGARVVRRLIAEGFAADRGGDGGPALGLEAAHGRHRIVHAGGDRTGAVLHAFFVERLRALSAARRILVRERCTAMSLRTESGAVVGAVLRGPDGIETIRAEAIVLATGGYAGLFPRSSNSASSRGSGVVLAARAGALVADLEFVQFHPTVLHGSGALISEAVRGAGAVLLDGSGSRFMVERHPLAELAPRDVVSREIDRLLRQRGEDAVRLDATVIERAEGAGALARRFPGISAATAALGYDWRREPIPVSPAAHYTMGGVVSDLDGRSSVPGLFVAGEAACTGVHGANRLASNSLLEGLVFGERAGRAARSFVAGGPGETGRWEPRGTGFHALERDSSVVGIAAPSATRVSAAVPASAGESRAEMIARPGTASRAMTSHAESASSIRQDAAAVSPAVAALRGVGGDDVELVEMIRVAASERTESRGAHQRFDHPDTDPAQAVRRAYRFVLPSDGRSLPEAGSIHAPVSTSISEQRSLTSC